MLSESCCACCPARLAQVRGKAMADKAGDMMDIVRDILLTPKFDDYERFKQARIPFQSCFTTTTFSDEEEGRAGGPVLEPSYGEGGRGCGG